MFFGQSLLSKNYLKYSIRFKFTRDPHETPRTVNHISWHSDGAHKIAASYCNLEFQSINDRTIVNSYIWDIGRRFLLFAKTNPNVIFNEN